MSQSLLIHSDKYAVKGLNVPKFAKIAGVSIPQNHFHDPISARQIPQSSLEANLDSDLQNFNLEQIGFKVNIEQLNLWTEEESTRYLLHNIFCFR